MTFTVSSVDCKPTRHYKLFNAMAECKLRLGIQDSEIQISYSWLGRPYSINYTPDTTADQIWAPIRSNTK